MNNDNAEFRPVTFKKELENILLELEAKSTVLAGLTEDQHQFQFKIRHLTDDVIYVEAIAPVGRALQANEPLQVLFGLPDGLYLVKTRVSQANQGQVAFHLGTEVYRLQRRNNFRTLIPSTYKVDFRITNFKTQSVAPGIVFSPIDLSAGGMRVRWPAQGLAKPTAGDQLAGILILPSGRQIELFGLVKTVSQDPVGVTQAGIEYQNLSVRDEQSLLFVCMQIHREQQPRKQV
jgi:c-di-GMP-binding flagellar brake protein YcgR